jgi:acyl carrier protein
MSDPIRTILAEVLQTPADSVVDSLAFNESKAWDSVAHINLMLAFEDAFGISIPDDDVVELTSVHAIRRYLADRVALAVDGAA